MSESSTFRISFHVNHPTMLAEEIENNFPFPIRFSQSVGLPRKTKGGKPLEGIYSETNISFLMHDATINANDISIPEFIEKSFSIIPEIKIREIINSGGICSFMIGIFSNKNIMFEMKNDFLKKIANLGIGMKFDFYGGEGP